LRGLHFQRGEQAQSKTVYCVRGRLFDVAVDIRPGSETYGKWFGAELTAENKRALLVPRGFAHGFYALDDCELLYFVGNAVYDKSAEGGLRWNCGQVGIEWPLVGEPQVNERDAGFPGLDGLEAA
jgi:dTDP-4-dehydrorhamnose 3,5-epimerase